MLAEDLVELMSLVFSEKGYREKLNIITQKSAEISGADRTCIIIHNKRGELVIKSGFPLKEHGISQKINLLSGEKFLRDVMTYGRILWISNPSFDPRTSYMRDLIRQYRIRSVVYAPLCKKEYLGLLVFDFIGEKVVAKEKIMRIIHNLTALVSMILSTEYHKRREEEKLRSLERMYALGENAARVSHTIRNRLASLGGFARRIEKLLPEESEIKDYTSIIIEEVSRLEKLVGDIINFSKVPEVQLSLNNLNGFLKTEMVRIFQTHTTNSIRYKFELDKRLWKVNVPFDKDKMLICLQNIVKNAIEASATYIFIRSKINTKKGEVAISFFNDGEKIAPTIINDIFCPFVTTKIDGTGLGLANVKAIINAHGGEIMVECNEKTEFRITLPLFKK